MEFAELSGKDGDKNLVGHGTDCTSPDHGTRRTDSKSPAHEDNLRHPSNWDVWVLQSHDPSFGTRAEHVRSDSTEVISAHLNGSAPKTTSATPPSFFLSWNLRN